MGESPRAGRKVLLFQLSGQAYGLPVDRVREILPMPLLERAPGLPPVLAGFVNLGGTAIPVVNLARLFAVAEQAPGRYTPLVILHYGDRALGLLVDSVCGVVRVPDEAIVPFSDNLCLNSCAEGLAAVGETSFVLLADDRLLREQEHRRIEELAAIEQSRLDALQGAQA
ncbi:MAG TPA: chemotaxis protein CheW [Pirellulales bacterium]